MIVRDSRSPRGRPEEGNAFSVMDAIDRFGPSFAGMPIEGMSWAGSNNSFLFKTADKKQSTYKPRPPRQVECGQCPNVFTTFRPDAKYCSGTCRQRAHRGRPS